MIDVKQATQRAEQYLKGMILGASNIVLEEVELTDDEQFWLITLSYNDPAEGIKQIFGKTVKVFRIRRKDGEVIAMKIRELR